MGRVGRPKISTRWALWALSRSDATRIGDRGPSRLCRSGPAWRESVGCGLYADQRPRVDDARGTHLAHLANHPEPFEEVREGRGREGPHVVVRMERTLTGWADDVDPLQVLIMWHRDEQPPTGHTADLPQRLLEHPDRKVLKDLAGRDNIEGSIEERQPNHIRGNPDSRRMAESHETSVGGHGLQVRLPFHQDRPQWPSPAPTSSSDRASIGMAEAVAPMRSKTGPDRTPPRSPQRLSCS